MGPLHFRDVVVQVVAERLPMKLQELVPMRIAGLRGTSWIPVASRNAFTAASP